MPDDVLPTDEEVEAHNLDVLRSIASHIPPERHEKVIREMRELNEVEREGVRKAVERERRWKQTEEGRRWQGSEAGYHMWGEEKARGD